MRKIRLPTPVVRLVSLNQDTWSITDPVTATYKPPRTIRSNSVRVNIARPAMAAPRAREPVSPMMIFAGDAFHHRNPKQAPVRAAATVAKSSADAPWEHKPLAPLADPHE